MTVKIEVDASKLIITQDSDDPLRYPKKDCYIQINGTTVKFYDSTSPKVYSNPFFTCELSDCVNASNVTFTKTTLLEFDTANLGFSEAGGAALTTEQINAGGEGTAAIYGPNGELQALLDGDGEVGVLVSFTKPSRFNDAVRYFIPHPIYCFSDVAGTTPAVQDGPVGLWQDTLNRGNPASQSIAGARPILRKGAKNLLVNSTMQGAVNGTPGTLPTGYNSFAPSGISRTQTFVDEVVNGISMRVAQVRFFGTATAAGALSFDINLSNTVPAVSGMQFTYQVLTRLVAGSLPAFTAPFRSQMQYRNAAGTPVGASNFVAVSPTANWQASFVSGGTVETSATSVTCENRIDVAVGTVVDFTIGIAAPMLESGTLTPSAYAATSGTPASNGVGPWWLDFDGVQSRLEFAQPVVRSGEGAFTCVAAEPYQSSSGAPVWHGDASSIGRFGSLVFSNISPRSVNASYRNTAGTQVDVITQQETRAVYSTYVGSDNTIVANVNLVRRGANVQLPPPPYTLNNSTIGAARRNSAVDLFYRGNIYGMALANFTPTTSEARLVELFIASVAEIAL